VSISRKLLDKEIESERVQFKKLIATNPNYFGNIIDKTLIAEYPIVFQMSNNTKYEELKCVGLYPEYDLLEAVFEVKLPYGFKGPLCKKGSKEYVAFYIDYDDGAGFISVGAPAEVNLHDISFVNGGHIFYAVRKPFIPKQYLKCDTPQIVKVRAILSWEKLPTGPNYNPVWGNVIDVWVQIRPKQIGPFVFPISVSEFKSIEPEPNFLIKPLPKAELLPPIEPIPPVEKYVIMGGKEEIKVLIDRSIAAEKRIIEKGEIEEERFEFKKLIMKNPNYFGSITESKDPNEIMKAIDKLPPKTLEDLFAEYIFDPDKLIPIKPLLLKTKYEELKCVGLYPEGDLLEAVLEVKLPYGFNGDLCTLGSKEYVAFYIDWGTGVYEHIATTTVGVHDIPDVNDKHLFYAVKAKISDIEAKLKDCTIENIVKVKAILSWNVDPTPFGHTYKPTWGNVLKRNIQIRPVNGESVKCEIEIVNKVHVDEISSGVGDRGLAIKIDASSNTVPGIFDRPLGGIIACWGNINVSKAEFYRFMYKSDVPGADWKPVTDKRKARNIFGFTITRTPDSKGWFSKGQYDNDVKKYSLTALVHWRSYGKNGGYQLRLELADAGKNPLPDISEVPILLDNTELELLTFGGTPAPLPAKGVVVKDNLGNYRKCGTFKGSEEIKIFGNFRDDYFKSFRLKVFGGNINASGVGIGTGRYDSGLPSVGLEGIIGAVDNGPGKEIGTLDLCTIPQIPDKVKCSYGIELAIWDRAIVGYVSGYQFKTRSHGIDTFVTFEWEPTGCP
jgi:hypothetical protein